MRTSGTGEELHQAFGGLAWVLGSFYSRLLVDWHGCLGAFIAGFWWTGMGAWELLQLPFGGLAFGGAVTLGCW